jgi:hypothetical protein
VGAAMFYSHESRLFLSFAGHRGMTGMLTICFSSYETRVWRYNGVVGSCHRSCMIQNSLIRI